MTGILGLATATHSAEEQNCTCMYLICTSGLFPAGLALAGDHRTLESGAEPPVEKQYNQPIPAYSSTKGLPAGVLKPWQFITSAACTAVHCCCRAVYVAVCLAAVGSGVAGFRACSSSCRADVAPFGRTVWETWQLTTALTFRTCFTQRTDRNRRENQAETVPENCTMF